MKRSATDRPQGPPAPLLHALGEEDRYKIVCGNVARIYGFDA